MNKDVKLAEEELIFSSENIIQNIKFLNEDFNNGNAPRAYDFVVDGKDVKVIMLHRMTATALMGSFKHLSFRLIVNFYEGVILAHPIHSKELMMDDLALEDYAERIAGNVIGMQDDIGHFGSRIGRDVKSFLLWNFYNHKVYLNL